MNDKEEILNAVYDALGEEGCGMTCCEVEITHDADGWKLFMEGFMEPWPLGPSVAEAKAAIASYANMRFGLS